MSLPATNNLKLIPFHVKHLEVSDLREHEDRLFRRIPNATERLLELQKKSFESITVIYDGRIITCCGVVLMCEGVCEIWQIPSIHVAKYPILFSKTIKSFIKTIASSLKIHRMQTASAVNELNDQWMEFLGFESEGIMKQYNDLKEDYKMWARFKWE